MTITIPVKALWFFGGVITGILGPILFRFYARVILELWPILFHFYARVILELF